MSVDIYVLFLPRKVYTIIVNKLKAERNARNISI